jgi:hypothetical protein
MGETVNIKNRIIAGSIVALFLLSLAVPVVGTIGSPVEGATVEVHVIGSNGYNKVSQLTTDSSGNYEVMVAPSQIWDMEVRKEGYLSEQIFDYGKGPNITSDFHKDILLVKMPAKTCRVEGYVKDTSGSAIDGATVSIMWGDNQSHTVFLPDVTTDSTGHYSFAAMPGDYTLWFNAKGYMGVYECRFSLYSGVKIVNETLEPYDNGNIGAKSHIVGIISDEDGNPLSGVNIVVNKSSIPVTSAVSDSAGHYSVNVTSGVYNITYSFMDWSTWTQYYTVTKQITVGSGQTYQEDITMIKVPTYNITLQIQNETGAPIPYAQV